MKILQLRTLEGPNLFHNKPVIAMTIDLEDLRDVTSHDIPEFINRLMNRLPGLRSHRCSLGYEGGFVERLHRGTYFAHIIEHIALELSAPAGIKVGYGKAVYEGPKGVYKIVVRYLSEDGMKFLLRTSVAFAESLARNQEFDLDSQIEEAKRIVQDSQLGPSTQAIVQAAEQRGIPWSRLNQMNLIQFGFGKNRRLIQATTTSQTGDIAVDIAQDKDLTKKLLTQVSIRVPRGVVVYSENEAVEVFHQLGVPVVLKPVDGHHGQGVSLRLCTDDCVREAYRVASAYCQKVVVEELFEGNDYRILVVDGKMAAAAQRIPAHVMGDEVHTVSQLIDLANQNPLRGDGHEKPMTKIKLDCDSDCYFKRNGIFLQDIPKKGQVIYLRETANLSTGGIAVDVTDQVHREIQLNCERAARVVGLDICGIDLIVQDITQPLSEQRGGIIEVNAGPGLRMHHYPSFGKARDVGAAIIESLYPPGSSARIPIISITGTNGKTTVTRLIGHILTDHGVHVGMTTSDGIYINHDRVAVGDTTGPISAKTVLCDPGVEVAVLETARGGIARRGLGYDWSDIGVLTNISADHIGQDGIETIDDILRIKLIVAERVREGGTLILNADDPLLMKVPQDPTIEKISRSLIFFSQYPDHVRLRRHMSTGGGAYFYRNGWIYEATHGEERQLISVTEIPMTFGGTARFQISNLLAGIAACRAHGLALKPILEGLRSFQPNRDNLGRANIYRVKEGLLLLDFGHNPEAFRAVCQMTAQWSARRVTAVVGVPGDRSDELIRMSGKIAAQGFDRVIVREDTDLRGRAPGEAAQILCEAIAQENPGTSCMAELNEAQSFERAVEEMTERDVVVFFYDDYPLMQKLLKKWGAEPVLDASKVQLKRKRTHDWSRMAG